MAKTLTWICQYRMNILVIYKKATFRHLPLWTKHMTTPVSNTPHSFSTLMAITGIHNDTEVMPISMICDHLLLSRCVALLASHRLPMCGRYMSASRGHELLCSKTQVYGTQQKRFNKRRRRQGKGGDEMSDDSDDDTDYDDDYDVFEEEKDGPAGYKQLTLHVKSLRADSLISSGLNISRARVDEMFYGSKLKLNGQKLLKKSQQLQLDDYVDMVLEGHEDTLKVKRIKVLKVRRDRTQKSDRLIVIVRAWKTGFEIEKPKTFMRENDDTVDSYDKIS